MRTLITTTFLLFLAFSATAQTTVNRDLNAKKLHDSCKIAVSDEWKKDVLKTGECYGFIEAWMQMSLWLYDPTPAGQDATVGQFARVFIKYVQDHPEKEQYTAAYVMCEAAYEAHFVEVRKGTRQEN